MISIKNDKLIVEKNDDSKKEIFEIKEYKKSSKSKYEGKPVSIFCPNSKKYWKALSCKSGKNEIYKLILNENEYKFDALYSKRYSFKAKEKDEMISLMMKNDKRSIGVSERGQITISKNHNTDFYRFQYINIENANDSKKIVPQKPKKLKQTTLTQMYPNVDDTEVNQERDQNQTTLTQYFDFEK